MAPPQPEATETMRIDKWLWCARFYKTRAIAVDAINKGQVSVNNAVVKPSKEIRVGDRIGLKQAHIPKTVDVRALAHTRGPAPIAQQLYAETADSVALRSALEGLCCINQREAKLPQTPGAAMPRPPFGACPVQ